MRFDQFAMTSTLFAIQTHSVANPANRHPKPVYITGTLDL
jgi:hypothetical protein